jgi:hypothetical protein
MSPGPSLYDTDFYAWTVEQAALLRDGKVQALDLANLAEEIESLGKSQSDAVWSHFQVLLRHLLKWRYQPTHRSRSWRRTILTQRLALARKMGTQGTLYAQRGSLLDDAYPGARRLAVVETGLPLTLFPETCPWTPEQVLDEDFWPEETG